MYKKQFLLLTTGFILLSACDRKPFVEHKLKFEKIAGNCGKVSDAFKMTSNFGGERFEFEKCLPADFTKDQITTSRRGDTVVINFRRPEGDRANFAVTLDIDSYPKYSFITIDDDTYVIAAAK